MKIRITWVERETRNAACIGLDETVSASSLADARESAEYSAACQGIDLERYECAAACQGIDLERYECVVEEV